MSTQQLKDNVYAKSKAVEAALQELRGAVSTLRGHYVKENNGVVEHKESKRVESAFKWMVRIEDMGSSLVDLRQYMLPDNFDVGRLASGTTQVPPSTISEDSLELGQDK
jgi:hypothetical protein